jgi:hypothetical protein
MLYLRAEHHYKQQQKQAEDDNDKDDEDFDVWFLYSIDISEQQLL